MRSCVVILGQGTAGRAQKRVIDWKFFAENSVAELALRICTGLGGVQLNHSPPLMCGNLRG